MNWNFMVFIPELQNSLATLSIHNSALEPLASHPTSQQLLVHDCETKQKLTCCWTNNYSLGSSCPQHGPPQPGLLAQLGRELIWTVVPGSSAGRSPAWPGCPGQHICKVEIIYQGIWSWSNYDSILNCYLTTTKVELPFGIICRISTLLKKH